MDVNAIVNNVNYVNEYNNTNVSQNINITDMLK